MACYLRAYAKGFSDPKFISRVSTARVGSRLQRFAGPSASRKPAPDITMQLAAKSVVFRDFFALYSPRASATAQYVANQRGEYDKRSTR